MSFPDFAEFPTGVANMGEAGPPPPPIEGGSSKFDDGA